MLVSAEEGKIKPPPPQKKKKKSHNKDENQQELNLKKTKLPLMLIKQQIKIATRKCSSPPT